MDIKKHFTHRIKAAVILSFLTASLFTGCGKKAEAAVPVLPPADSAADYQWTGDYLDETGGKAILSIEPSQLYGKDYYVTIYIPSGEAAFSLWEFDGNYDERLNAIVYSDCVRTNVDTGIIMGNKTQRTEDKGEGAKDEKESPVARVFRDREEDEEEGAASLAYTDGTGMIFTSSDVLFWVDDKDKRGEELRFRRMSGGEQ